MAVAMTAFARCARIGGITGGARDSVAPVVVRVDPGQGATNFAGRSIMVEFDEYVELRDLQKELYTSPKMTKTPTATLHGRGFRIDILDDSLLENQTYSVNFGGAVVDNHEGNAINGFRYVFSTGGEIDSMVMSGYTEDASKGDSVSKSFVYFFDAALDSIPEYDSIIFKNKPEAIGRAENNGIFIAQNLKPKSYRVYAVEDENSNQMYDAGVDRVGFLDSIYNPAEMRDFEAHYDTTRSYIVAQPQTYFRMFRDRRPARQVLVEPTRPEQHKIMMSFAAEWPQIERFTLEGIDSARVITEYLKPTRDSMALWLDVPSEQLPDTIRGEIIYLRPDSTGVEVPFTEELELTWRKVESSAERRERERREKDIEQGREVDSLPNPFRMTVPVGEINPEKGLEFEFGMPLSTVDEEAIELTTGDSTNVQRVAARLVRDTAEVRRWRLSATWREGQRYRLNIPAGVLRNVAGEVNDSIVQVYEVMPAAEVATLIFNITGKTPESEYILELTDEMGSRVLDERRHVRTGRVRFGYVAPGKVRLRITEDVNANGEWNTGNLVNRAQPERVEFYVEKGDEPSFTVRAGWEEQKAVDMSRVFAPITIESVWEKLARDEEARMEKYREWWLENRERKRRDAERGQQTGPSAAGMLQGATGMNLPGF